MSTPVGLTAFVSSPCYTGGAAGRPVPGSERIHWGGLSAALAGATVGVLLATVWSDVPAATADVRVGAAPGGLRVGAGLGW